MLNTIKKKINSKILDIKYASAISVAAARCNETTFSPIKGCNQGKDVVLCGGGPTLSQYTPMQNKMHVALNRALLNEKIHYDWFIADDWDGVYFFKDELKAYPCRKFFGHQIGGGLHRQIPESFRIECGADRYYTDSFLVQGGFNSRFNCDIDKLPVGNMANIALSAMQIVLYTLPEKIYLVGCDASSGHFIQPKKLTKEDIARQEKDMKMAVSSDKVIEQWRDLKEFAKAFYPETRIISINPIGLKGIFEDEYQ